MDTPENLQALLQLGFAAGVAGWLVRWMTTTQQRCIDKNTSVVLNLQLSIGELYRLVLLQDAQLRGLDLVRTDEMTADCQAAANAYQQTIDRLDTLKSSIERTLESL